MATTKLYANKDGEKARVAFMRLGTADGSKKVVRLQKGMQVLFEDWPMCSITATAGHTTGFTPATLRYGQPWSVTFVPDAGYCISSVTVTMGGTDITASVYSDHVISIPYVSGDVVITIDDSNVVNTNMFTKRTTADGITLLNNKALLKGIRGNSGLFSQRWYYGGTLNYNTTAGTPTNISVGTGTTAATMYYSGHFHNNGGHTTISIGARLTVGRKYLVSFKATFPNATISRVYMAVGQASGKAYMRTSSSWYTLNANNEVSGTSIITANYTIPAFDLNDNTNQWCPSDGIDFVINYINFIDLTVLFGAGNEPTTVAAFRKFFATGLQYDMQSIVINNAATNYISKDDEETTLQNVTLNLATLTGKLNGSGESVIIFPDGLKSSCNEAVNDTYDEIKQVNGVWKAFKRIGTERASNEISGRGEYEILENEEVYVLDNQTLIPELIVADGGTEEIQPSVIPTPTSMPAVLEIQYGSIPSRGLLGGGLAKGGGDDEPTDGEEIDYEEEPVDDGLDDVEPSEEPIEEEPIEEPKEDEKDEREPIEPIIEEKQQLKK